MSINKSRGFLYKLAKFSGDFQAVKSGVQVTLKAMAMRCGGLWLPRQRLVTETYHHRRQAAGC